MHRYTDEFERFWKKWPGRWSKESGRVKKEGKYKASLYWERLSKADKEHVMVIVGKLKSMGTMYLQDAWRWLRDRKFDDY